MWRKSISLVIILLVGLAASIGVSNAGELLPSHASSGKPIDVANASMFLEKLMGVKGKSGVWKLWARTVTGKGGQEYLRGKMAFRPFASSAGLCRSYVLEIRAPSPWVYGHQGSAGYGKDSYEVSSELRMAIRRDGDKCGNIDFSSYFRVNREMTDELAMQFLGYIEAVIKDWNAQKSATKKVPINLGQLKRIDIVEKKGKPVAEYAFKVDDIGIRTFDVNLPVKGKPHYSTAIAIP